MSDRKTSGASLVHPAYRHLERAPRLVGLTLAQWTGLVIAAASAYALARVLPFSSTYNLSISSTLIGVPLVVQMTASGGVNLFGFALAVARWRRRARLHMPGEPSRTPMGYELIDPAPTAPAASRESPIRPSWEELWG